MSTIDDFFAPADENNRSELDAEIRQAENDRLRQEEKDRQNAIEVHRQYKAGEIKKLTNKHIYDLIRFDLAHMTETTEYEYGRLIIHDA